MSVDLIDDIVFSESSAQFRLKDGNQFSFSNLHLDSLTFTTTPGSEDKNPYRVFQLNINTADDAAVTSKEEYVPCFISLGWFPTIQAVRPSVVAATARFAGMTRSLTA